MNNKGQTLVLFALLLPFIFILICILVDLGLLYTEKKKIQNTVKEIITSQLKQENINVSDSEKRINTFLYNNIDNVTIKKVKVTDKEIMVTVLKEYKSIFNAFNKNKYEIKVSYKGYKLNGAITIKKE